MTNEADMYPSRSGQCTKLVGRQYPDVCVPKGTRPPIEQSFIDSYDKQEFVVLDNVFSAEEVSRFQQELERLRTDPQARESGETITKPSSNDIRSVFSVHENSPLFKSLSADRRLADLARYLLNDDVHIHQPRRNYKPGFRGKEFCWHSDFETLHMEDGIPRKGSAKSSLPTVTDQRLRC